MSTNLSSVGQFHFVSAPNLYTANFPQLHELTGSSFIMRGVSGIQTFALNQASHVEYLEFSGGAPTDRVKFILGEDSAAFTIGVLNITGCWDFGLNGDFNVDTAIFSNNGFFDLDLTSVKISSNLTIFDNVNIGNLTLPPDMSIPYIQIQNNPVEGAAITGVSGAWPWGLKNMTSVLLNGAFETGFL